MRVLVEILHPAHVHFFRNAIEAWRRRGDSVLVLSRDKECANPLLEAYDIPHTSISRLQGGTAGLLKEMIIRDGRMWRAARRFKPDVLVGIMGVTIAQVGRLIRKPAIVFYDTENATLTNRVVYPLAHSVCTPDCYQGAVRGNHVTYPGYHELAYLHPNRFTPDPGVPAAAGIESGSDFFIIRFVSWQASHDIGEAGLSLDFKRRIVERLAERGRVLITSEGALPDDLVKHQFPLAPQNMHHFMAFAKMLVGESATMASESAVLGVPALFISDTGRGYTDEEERDYGLVFNFKTPETDAALACVDRLLAMPDLKEKMQQARARLLEDKMDTTEWMLEYVDRVVQDRH